MTKRNLYWFGNVAKFDIANRICDLALTSDRTLEIVDLGAGLGGDWDKVISNNSNLIVHMWEPHFQYLEALRERYRDISRIHVHQSIEELYGKADFGTSLSVLEHVKNPIEHIRAIEKVLKPNGIFFMNFDDGHFRNSSIIKKDEEFWIRIAEIYRTLISYLIPKFVPTNIYQKRISLRKIQELLEDSNLKVSELFFNHYESLKKVAKSSGDSVSDLDFMNSWLEFERNLEHLYKLSSGEKPSIDILWEKFSTRTFILRKGSL